MTFPCFIINNNNNNHLQIRCFYLMYSFHALDYTFFLHFNNYKIELIISRLIYIALYNKIYY